MAKKKKPTAEPPVISFGSLSFEESNYKRGDKKWMATTLRRACEDQGLEPFDYPLACYDMVNKYFDLDNMDDFIWQMKRTLEADYEKYRDILEHFNEQAAELKDERMRTEMTPSEKVLRCKVDALESSNKTLTNSNNMMEMKIKSDRETIDSLREMNESLCEEVEYLKNRGFWARLFNKI